jgi:hypothetical protein
VAYLHIQSPLPECGKSRLLEVLEALVEHPWFTGRVTAAVLMRKIDAEHPVLLLDESDAAFGGDKEYAEALRGQLNTGFHRSGKASACVGQGSNLSYKDFSTFGPKAIAGIGRLDPTIESRSIPIALKRRTKAETIAKWRRRDAHAAAEPLRTRLAAVMATAVETLKGARPTMPDGLGDRAEDVLEPLFAIADLAGGDWPERTRRAAVTLMGTAARVAQETEQNLGLELLADIRTIFEDHDNPAALRSEDIIKDLVAIDDRPWATFGKSQKPITAHRLRLMLKRFDVHPGGQMWVAGKNVRGWRLASFAEAFDRYIPRDPGFKVLERYNANENGPEVLKNEVLEPESSSTLKTAVSPNKYGGSSALALQTPDPGDGGAQPEDQDDDQPAIFGS